MARGLRPHVMNTGQEARPPMRIIGGTVVHTKRPGAAGPRAIARRRRARHSKRPENRARFGVREHGAASGRPGRRFSLA
jgi:hypothetical protein